MKPIVAIVGAVVGALVGGFLGWFLVRLLIGGNLATAGGWFLIICAILFVGLLVVGGWLGSKLSRLVRE